MHDNGIMAGVSAHNPDCIKRIADEGWDVDFSSQHVPGNRPGLQRMCPIITLTTDFGLGSQYVAEMKAAILRIQRTVQLIDISHDITPQNIRQGAIVLETTTPRFPPESIHVAVIDPGVGTDRSIVYCRVGNQHYVVPDNGLLSLLTRRKECQRMIAIENPEYWHHRVSSTFHGRDIMAPVAAHLSCGVDPEKLGSPRDRIVSLNWPEVEKS